MSSYTFRVEKKVSFEKNFWKTYQECGGPESSNNWCLDVKKQLSINNPVSNCLKKKGGGKYYAWNFIFSLSTFQNWRHISKIDSSQNFMAEDPISFGFPHGPLFRLLSLVPSFSSFQGCVTSLMSGLRK